MKLVIHCGLHKTATTSFQKICDTNRNILYELGVNYPNFREHKQHSHLLWEVQKSGLETLSAFLQKSFSESKNKCHTVLISGEDFENCIVDVGLALEVEALAAEAGFDGIEWIFVTRSIDSYISSIYSELSKHGVVLRRDILKRAAKDRGCFYISSNNYNYIFVFDFPRFAERFQQRVSKNIIEYNKNDFCREYPGAIVLRRILHEEAFTQFGELADITLQKHNERLDSVQIEANYVSNAFGISRLRRRRFRPLIAPLIWLRRFGSARRNSNQ